MENGETLRLTKNGKTISCTMDNLVFLRCIKTVIIFQQHFVFNIEINGISLGKVWTEEGPVDVGVRWVCVAF